MHIPTHVPERGSSGAYHYPSLWKGENSHRKRGRGGGEEKSSTRESQIRISHQFSFLLNFAFTFVAKEIYIFHKSHKQFALRCQQPSCPKQCKSCIFLDSCHPNPCGQEYPAAKKKYKSAVACFLFPFFVASTS